MMDLKDYNKAQIVECFLSPQNRHETRVLHSCDDETLYRNPQWLMQNWIETGKCYQFSKDQNRWGG